MITRVKLAGTIPLTGLALVITFAQIQAVEPPLAPFEPAPLEGNCRNGEPAACLELAERYADGRGVAVNPGRAVDYHKDGCMRGGVESCAVISAYYRIGWIVALDENLSLDYATRACKLGSKDYCRIVDRKNPPDSNLLKARCLDGEREDCDSWLRQLIPENGLKQALWIVLTEMRAHCGKNQDCGKFRDRMPDNFFLWYFAKNCGLGDATGCALSRGVERAMLNADTESGQSKEGYDENTMGENMAELCGQGSPSACLMASKEMGKDNEVVARQAETFCKRREPFWCWYKALADLKKKENSNARILLDKDVAAVWANPPAAWSPEEMDLLTFILNELGEI